MYDICSIFLEGKLTVFIIFKFFIEVLLVITIFIVLGLQHSYSTLGCNHYTKLITICHHVKLLHHNMDYVLCVMQNISVGYLFYA